MKPIKIYINNNLVYETEIDINLSYYSDRDLVYEFSNINIFGELNKQIKQIFLSGTYTIPLKIEIDGIVKEWNINVFDEHSFYSEYSTLNIWSKDSIDYLEILKNEAIPIDGFAKYVLIGYPKTKDIILYTFVLSQLAIDIYREVSFYVENSAQLANPFQAATALTMAIHIAYTVFLIAEVVLVLNYIYKNAISAEYIAQAANILNSLRAVCAKNNIGLVIEKDLEEEIKDLVVIFPTTEGIINANDAQELLYVYKVDDVLKLLEATHNIKYSYSYKDRILYIGFKNNFNIASSYEVGLYKLNFEGFDTDNNYTNFDLFHTYDGMDATSTDIPFKNYYRAKLNDDLRGYIKQYRRDSGVCIAKRKNTLTIVEQIFEKMLKLFNSVLNLLINTINKIIGLANSVINALNNIFRLLRKLGIKVKPISVNLPKINTVNLNFNFSDRKAYFLTEQIGFGVPKIARCGEKFISGKKYYLLKQDSEFKCSYDYFNKYFKDVYLYFQKEVQTIMDTKDFFKLDRFVKIDGEDYAIKYVKHNAISKSTIIKATKPYRLVNYVENI
jgi:hypothetical protein